MNSIRMIVILEINEFYCILADRFCEAYIRLISCKLQKFLLEKILYGDDECEISYQLHVYKILYKSFKIYLVPLDDSTQNK